MTTNSVKRKRKMADGPDDHPAKRAKLDGPNDSNTVEILADEQTKTQDTETDPPTASNSQSQPSKKTLKRKINKLVPPRPFPTVPTSVSATGPRSAHTEGKNYICITRRTPLGAYLRRCKEVIIEDGYKTLHLSAMGAAIPHLLTLATSIPAVLPFATDQVQTEILTGTVEVRDEIIPEDEDEDISYETRTKSTISVVIKIGDGISDERPGKKAMDDHKVKGKKRRGQVQTNQLILSEPEQDEMDTR